MLTPPLRVLIVDDDALGRKRVRELLLPLQDVRIVGECASGDRALEMIDSELPDLVFLDVRMPGPSGLAVAEAIGTGRQPAFIFVTAFDIYMEHAFRLHALDYLTKPFTDARFHDALENARHRILKALPPVDVHAAVTSILRDQREIARRCSPVPIQQRSGDVAFLPRHEIRWLEAEGKHTRVHAGGRVLLWLATLGRAVELLDDRTFLRVHRSIVVNTARIVRAEPLWKGEFVLELDCGKRVGTGRGYTQAVRRLLGRVTPPDAPGERRSGGVAPDPRSSAEDPSP